MFLSHYCAITLQFRNILKYTFSSHILAILCDTLIVEFGKEMTALQRKKHACPGKPKLQHSGLGSIINNQYRMHGGVVQDIPHSMHRKSNLQQLWFTGTSVDLSP